jgi:hypothetical protein
VTSISRAAARRRTVAGDRAPNNAITPSPVTGDDAAPCLDGRDHLRNAADDADQTGGSMRSATEEAAHVLNIVTSRHSPPSGAYRR